MNNNKKQQLGNKWSLTILIVIFFLFLTQLSACLADGQYKKTPASTRVDISQPNFKTELLVHIGKEDDYAFSLRFKFKDKEDSRRVLDLVRGEDAYGRRTNGEKTAIGIEIYTIKEGQNVLVSLGGGESFAFYASGNGHFEKLIYTDYLMPGDYRVVVETKGGNPKFKDVDVEVHIGKAHKPK